MTDPSLTDDAILDSSPETKLAVLNETAEYYGADLFSMVCSDKTGKMTSVSVYCTGEDAIALRRWLNRRNRKPRKRLAAGRLDGRGINT